MAPSKNAGQDAILLHAFFAVVCALVLATPSAISMGVRLCGLVILYNTALPIVASRRGHREWLELWQFLVPLSALQIFPDWFLADQLHVLVFPVTGAPHLGPVPLFMGGMWTIPLFVILLLSQRAALVASARPRRRTKSRARRKTGSRPSALRAAALASAMLFIGSEAVLWKIPVWQAQNVTTIAHVALYLIVPETLLGPFRLLAFEASRRRSPWHKLGAAYSVMVAYLGGVCFFYLLFERLLFS